MMLRLIFSTILLLLFNFTGAIAAMEIDQNPSFDNPNLNPLVEEVAMPFTMSLNPQSQIERVKQKHEQRLLSIDGVVGVGIQRNEIGQEVIVVYLRDAGVQKSIPSNLEGFVVKTEVTGFFDAF
ncbi:hypothetical protein [Iningainema tapete]|uniref:Uncharacterized protein n=1 Tax=Iningainema tapete BLCC-T55 TaxID=2748662 RepID=A0A8J6XH78_9CYAN|nr:hypothetical protein [Iningainema tapete]MBD2773290.1 hypothetical protein [Iningainema tapete BLCC-T55]